MADYDYVLKFWGPVEADSNTIGGLVLSRYLIRYPASRELFSFFDSVPDDELAGNPGICIIGSTKLKKIYKLLKAKGNHASMIKLLATRHARKYKVPIKSYKLITEILGEVMAEMAGLDTAGQQALMRTMNVIWDDFATIYTELGLDP